MAWSGVLGFLLGSVTVTLLQALLPADAMNSYGWRIPFLIAGPLGLIGLYVLVIAYGFAIAIRSRSQFGRLVALGVTTTLFLYLFINVAMVMGLIPVVGVPLPMISYGGTAMLTIMLGLGMVLGVSVHRDVRIGRAGVDED